MELGTAKLGITAVYGGRARSAIQVVLVLGAHWALYNAVQYSLYAVAPSLFRPSLFRVPLVGLIEFVAVGVCLCFVWRSQLAAALSPRRLKFLQYFAVGALLGSACFSLHILGYGAAGILAITGHFRSYPWLGAAAGALLITAPREVLFRGFVLNRLEQAWGSMWALCLSSVFFGIAMTHGWELGRNLPYLAGHAASVALLGLVYGAGYLAFRQLWFAIGLSFGYALYTPVVYGDWSSGLRPYLRVIWHTHVNRPFGEVFWMYCATMLFVAILFLSIAIRRTADLSPSWPDSEHTEAPISPEE